MSLGAGSERLQLCPLQFELPALVLGLKIHGFSFLFLLLCLSPAAMFSPMMDFYPSGIISTSQLLYNCLGQGKLTNTPPYSDIIVTIFRIVLGT